MTVVFPCCHHDLDYPQLPVIKKKPFPFIFYYSTLCPKYFAIRAKMLHHLNYKTGYSADSNQYSLVKIKNNNNPNNYIFSLSSS